MECLRVEWPRDQEKEKMKRGRRGGGKRLVKRKHVEAVSLFLRANWGLQNVTLAPPRDGVSA